MLPSCQLHVANLPLPNPNPQALVVPQSFIGHGHWSVVTLVTGQWSVTSGQWSHWSDSQLIIII